MGVGWLQVQYSSGCLLKRILPYHATFSPIKSPTSNPSHLILTSFFQCSSVLMYKNLSILKYPTTSLTSPSTSCVLHSPSSLKFTNFYTKLYRFSYTISYMYLLICKMNSIVLSKFYKITYISLCTKYDNVINES